MTVNETHLAAGSFSLTLHPTIPRGVRAALAAYGHVLITPAPLQPHQLGTALTAARYVGVLRSAGFDAVTGDYTISGAGLATWLGDEDGKGPVIRTPVRLGVDADPPAAAVPFATAVRAVLPDAYEGTIHAVGGGYSGIHYLETPRAAIDFICKTMGAEWRVRTDGRWDLGTPAQLFGSTPTAIVARTAADRDAELRPLAASALSVDTDHATVATRVVVVGPTVNSDSYDEKVVTATAEVAPGDNPYLDLFGAPADLTVLIDEPESTPGNADPRAQAALTERSAAARTVTLSTGDYDVSGDVTPGGYVYCYDLDAGLVDPATSVRFRGQVINPVTLRVVSLTWPVARGMGVYYRAADGTLTDLTAWVAFDDGDTAIEVGALGRTLAGLSTGTIAERVHASDLDTTVPGQPTGLAVTATGSYVNALGATRAWAELDWGQPLNLDGSTITDGDRYEVRYRQAAAPTAIARINVGGPQVTTPDGVVWVADAHFTGGEVSGGPADVANTDEDVLYLDERYGTFSYAIPIPEPGTYTVRLRTAELFFTEPGQRQYNVAIEGVTVLTNHDIIAHVGAATADPHTFVVTATGATLDVSFTPGAADVALLNAIEVLAGDATAATGTGDYAYTAVYFDTSALRLTDLDPGGYYGVSTQAVDANGNASGYPPDVGFTASPDLIAPSTPAAPTVAGNPLSVQVRHSLGRATGGTYNLEADLVRLDVHAGTSADFTADATNLVGSIPATASSLALGVPAIGDFPVPDTTPRWLRVRAVDAAGNASPASASATVTALLIGTQHIADAAITSAQIANAAITSAAIADLAVTTAKVANAAIAEELRAYVTPGNSPEFGSGIGPDTSAYNGLTLSETNYNNIFARRASDGAILFRLNSGGARSLTYDSSTGAISLRGEIVQETNKAYTGFPSTSYWTKLTIDQGDYDLEWQYKVSGGTYSREGWLRYWEDADGLAVELASKNRLRIMTGELRVRTFDNSAYAPLRASILGVRFTSHSTHTDQARLTYVAEPGGTFYRLTLASDNGVHVTNLGATEWRGVFAASFNVSSAPSNKRDVVPADDDVSLLLSTPIYRYRLPEDAPDRPRRWGLMVGQVPPDLEESGVAVDLYSLTTMNTRALQLLSARLDRLEARR